ncbi:MAG: peptidase M20 [Caulobacterales bacterium 68-7]|nr:MAG: peptidase M20 [Caulobacterales bacterium 68-7]
MILRRLLLPAAIALVATAAHAADVVDPKPLLNDVRVLSADDMEGRLIGSPGGAKARAYLTERLKGLGLPVTEQPFDTVMRDNRTVRGVNLIARVEGAERGGKVMVVSAHYDHLGVRNGEIYNGADDNASGVGAVLALASALKAQRPKHTVILALLDGEEGGLRGARAFVATPPVPLSSIGLNVNFDMLSKNGKNELYVSGASPQPYLRPTLEAVAKAAPVTMKLGHDTDADGKDNNWTNQSDHYAFAEKGVPWVYFGVEDHPEYHKPSDDFATIPQDFYVRATRTVISAVRALDAAMDGFPAR